MSRFTLSLLAASIATLFGAAGIARAGVVYEWTDAHGEMHYTDQWVPGAKLIRVETAHASTAAAAGAAQGIQSESDAASRDIQRQQVEQAVQADESKARAAQCTRDKAAYQKLIDSRRIYTVDKSGQRHFLSDADVEAARLKARQAMDADCGSGTP